MATTKRTWEAIIDQVYASVFSDLNKKRFEKITLYLSIIGFLLHLILIYAKKLELVVFSFETPLLDNPISAIYTPFTIILIYVRGGDFSCYAVADRDNPCSAAPPMQAQLLRQSKSDGRQCCGLFAQHMLHLKLQHMLHEAGSIPRQHSPKIAWMCHCVFYTALPMFCWFSFSEGVYFLGIPQKSDF